MVSDHDFGVWFQIAGFVLFYQLSAGKQLNKNMFSVNSEGSSILHQSQLSTPYLMTSKFTNPVAAVASGWMIYQSHLAVRSSHWMCCLVCGYENTEKGEDVVRFKSVCGNTLKILDTFLVNGGMQ